MRFYVAGKYSERKLIREVMNELESMGHTITEDWTKHTDLNKALIYAVRDTNGVKNCDALVEIMINHNTYQGAWVEFGIAIACDKPIYLIGDAGDDCIFTKYPLVTRFKTLERFYDFIRGVK
jgi:nucleoside 2-deoxyribosyltransferase